MARPAVRIQVVQWVLLLLLGALVARAAQVQVIQGERWAARAEARRTDRIVLPARRGTLYDRHGTPLAVTQETYHVGVARNELRRPSADWALIARRLGLSDRTVRRARDRRYAYFAGPYTSVQIEPLRRVRGVHLEPVLNRFYPSAGLAQAMIGRLGDDGRGASGLERTLDTLLAGTPGAAVVLKDRAGRAYESPARLIADPVAGHDVVLTLDGELQEIAQRALDEALRRMDAEGGDVVMLDPASGEILAVAARREGGATRASAFTDSYEPGSTAKVFVAAGLLERDRVGPAETVSGDGGRYVTRDRVIEDDEEHRLTRMTLADAIRVSSNVGTVKFASRLSPEEQFETLRAFGFGAPTGVEFPSESPGRLRLPRDWTRLSAASLAMGYEFAATPLQVAAAYAALANGGVLLQPTLVREIRAPDGDVAYRHRPEPVRRAVSRETATRLRELLAGAVESGTGTAAALTEFPLAAKTGTSRRVVEGRYVPGQYVASFAAIFPADEPQLVLVVKIDNPRKGSYFAAQTAAPVTRSVLEQALAARTVALDRSRLATAVPPAPRAPLDEDAGVVPYVVAWPYRPDTTAPASARTVPDVSGRTVREAVHTLHRRGFRVVLRGWGTADRTWPPAGERAPAGALVTLFAESRP
ncbi:MAG TPA: penicillin-binding transpeptidase domain-containing protein [Gemmatimonadales bacterium]|nr:penicillin-binding transpeptidase domain-containing protein [Gemmatimonadales bacterium]